MRRILAALLAASALGAQTGEEPSRLAPLDEISIQALGAPEIDSQQFQIDDDGTLRLPLAGSIPAAGLTPRELEAQIELGLGRYVRNPHALVAVVRYADRPVSVIGSVARPGVLQVNRPTTLLEVLSSVGGLAADAGPVVVLTRKGNLRPAADGGTPAHSDDYVVRIPVASLVDGQDESERFFVQPNDVVAVPKAKQVYVIGAVRQPGVFSAGEREGLSVLQAIALAGGLESHAAPKRSRVLSPNDNGPWLDETVDLKAMLAGHAPDRKLAGDEILFIPMSGAKATAAQIGRAALTIGTGAAIWSAAR